MVKPPAVQSNTAQLLWIQRVLNALSYASSRSPNVPPCVGILHGLLRIYPRCESGGLEMRTLDVRPAGAVTDVQYLKPI